MSILHADNFSRYGNVSALLTQGVYAEIADSFAGLLPDPDGVSPGRVLGWNKSAGGLDTCWRYALPNGAVSKCGTACRVWSDGLPEGPGIAQRFITFKTITNDPLASLNIQPNGALRMLIYPTAGGTVEYVTPAPVVTAKGWYHVEASYSHGGANVASFEVRVEGAAVLAFANVAATKNSDVGQVSGEMSFGPSAGGVSFYQKDLVIWDGNGALNNDFLGSVLVASIVPNADVSLNWSPSTGATGYPILANVPPNDGQYISASYTAGATPTIPPAYIGQLSDLPVEATTVKAVLAFARAGKVDGGDGSLQIGVVSGASTGLGANRPITVAQTYWRDVFETDPATGAAWLPGAVNAAKIQINRTA